MDKKLTLSEDNKVLFGVCGGVGEYFSIDPTIIRLLFVLLCFVLVGTPIIPYLIAILIIPSKNDNKNPKKTNDFYHFNEFKD